MEQVYLVKGVVCNNCATAIENKLKLHPKIESVSVDYDDHKLSVVFKNGKDISIDEINEIIKPMGYELFRMNKKQSIRSILGIGAIALLIFTAEKLGLRANPVISANMSLMMLFLAGLLTSFHCIAMCGGIAMTQSIGKQNSKYDSTYRALKYNLGRIISYTLLGGVIGGIGSVVTLGGTFRGMVSIAAGLFMVILSMKVLGLLKVKLPNLWFTPIKTSASSKGPFFVGLANGFMPCGPLQTMQLYALGTGTIFGGMSSMFFFSLGTVPMMMGLGLFTGLLSKNGGRSFIRASSVMVCVLGIIMINRGLALSGYGISMPSESIVIKTQEIEVSGKSTKDSLETNELSFEDTREEIKPYEIVDGVQVVQMSVMSDRYILSSPLVVGIPARIELDIQGNNRCNSPVLIPKAGVEVDLLRNEPVMEFTPDSVGDLKITCWMGMITTNASVVERLPN